MEVWLDSLGVNSGLLLNYVPKVPDGPSAPEQGGPHIGMWLAAEGYRKLPYAMIAAAGMIPDVTLAGSGVSQRALEFAQFVGLDTTRLAFPGPMDQCQIALIRLTFSKLRMQCGQCRSAFGDQQTTGSFTIKTMYHTRSIQLFPIFCLPRLTNTTGLWHFI